MTIEFESQGSRLLAVSVPNKNHNEYWAAMNEIKDKDNYYVIGFSGDFHEHHEAMKEAGIYHEHPMGPKPSINWNNEKIAKRQGRMIDEWHELNKRVSECWILLKIKE